MLEINNADFEKSAVFAIDYPMWDKDEIILLGRSNVGKSTFINKFCQRKKLAFISAKPGKTQTLNFFSINKELAFVDVPGYGYARVSKKMREEFGVMIETFLTTRENLRFAIVLIDFKVGPTNDDLLMYEFLKYYNLKVLIVATKKDKVKNSMICKQEKLILEKLKLMPGDDFIAYSATKERDMSIIYEKVEALLKCM